jgi:cyclophilin family peptidyl-prolyl cis-trans isomerase
VAFLEKNIKGKGWKETKSGLQYRIKKQGPKTGNTPNVTSSVLVNYEGRTITGKVFDSSKRRGKPTEFRPVDVIAGWTEALLMMHEGDEYEVALPAELAYKNRMMGQLITPGSVLLFDMELVKVKSREEELNPLSLINSLLDAPMQVWLILGYLALFILYSNFKHLIWGPAKKIPKVLVEDAKDKPENVRCFIDVQIGNDIDAKKGRIEVELFNTVCPKTCENFRALCTGEKGMGKPKWSGGKTRPLCYKGSKFHRIIDRFMAQGGDFESMDGSGGESIYGFSFPDEFDNGYITHSDRYLLSMANCGPNTNASQFFITFQPCLWLDTKHVVFGRVVKGKEHVDDIERCGPKDTNNLMNLSSSGVPSKPIYIIGCGQLDKDGKVMPTEVKQKDPAAESNFSEGEKSSETKKKQ